MGYSDNIHSRRKAFFRDKRDYSQLLRESDYGDCSEFIIDRYGDICTYRVYGKTENDFSLCER